MNRADLERTRAELIGYELALAAHDGSGLGIELADLISDDFVEFGASGRIWDAAAVRRLVASPTVERPTIERFQIEFLGDGVVLATYRITAPVTSVRSSVWIRREDAWQVRFHQGTPGPEPGAGPPG
jgi:hypothetical protein